MHEIVLRVGADDVPGTDRPYIDIQECLAEVACHIIQRSIPVWSQSIRKGRIWGASAGHFLGAQRFSKVQAL